MVRSRLLQNSTHRILFIIEDQLVALHQRNTFYLQIAVAEYWEIHHKQKILKIITKPSSRDKYVFCFASMPILYFFTKKLLELYSRCRGFLEASHFNKVKMKFLWFVGYGTLSQASPR